MWGSGFQVPYDNDPLFRESCESTASRQLASRSQGDSQSRGDFSEGIRTWECECDIVGLLGRGRV